MLAYVEAKDATLDGLSTYDTLEEIKRDLQGVTLNLISISEQDFTVTTAQVATLSDVLMLVCDELGAILEHAENERETASDGAEK